MIPFSNLSANADIHKEVLKYFKLKKYVPTHFVLESHSRAQSFNDWTVFVPDGSSGQ